MKRWSIACFAIAAASPAMAAPSNPDIAGQILNVWPGNGTIFVRHPDNRTEPATPYLLLFDGDSVEVTGQAVVVVQRTSRASATVTATSSPLHLTTADSATFLESAAHFFSRLSIYFQEPLKPIIVSTWTRGGPSPALSSPNYLAARAQRLPAGQKRVTVAWGGGPAQATLHFVSGSVQRSEISETGTASFDITTLQHATLSVGVDADGPRWVFVPAPPQEIPMPPWMQRGPADDHERAIAAAWLLSEGPTDWRVYALSEIETLQSKDPLASHLWRMLRSDQWPGPR